MKRRIYRKNIDPKTLHDEVKFTDGATIVATCENTDQLPDILPVVKASYLVEDENGDIFETYQYETDEETATHDAFQDIIDDAADVIDNEFEPATYTVKIKFEVSAEKSSKRRARKAGGSGFGCAATIYTNPDAGDPKDLANELLDKLKSAIASKFTMESNGLSVKGPNDDSIVVEVNINFTSKRFSKDPYDMSADQADKLTLPVYEAFFDVSDDKKAIFYQVDGYELFQVDNNEPDWHVASPKPETSTTTMHGASGLWVIPLADGSDVDVKVFNEVAGTDSMVIPKTDHHNVRVVFYIDGKKFGDAQIGTVGYNSIDSACTRALLSELKQNGGLDVPPKEIVQVITSDEIEAME